MRNLDVNATLRIHNIIQCKNNQRYPQLPNRLFLEVELPNRKTTFHSLKHM